jgi:KUP system potassium uptake protein
MVVTTVLAYHVARERGGWRMSAALAFLAGFLTIDLGYLGSNLMTIPHGGWLPLAMGLVLFTIMTTWRTGFALLSETIAHMTPRIDTFIGRLSAEEVPRIPGAAVFFTGRLEQTPPALQKLVRHTGVVHEKVVLVTVIIEPVPKTESHERIELTMLDDGFFRLLLRYGFMQGPNIPSDLAACNELSLPLDLDLDHVHYFVGQIDMVAGRKRHGMVRWRDKLFAFMAANTEDATARYQIPSDQIMNVGLHVGI